METVAAPGREEEEELPWLAFRVQLFFPRLLAVWGGGARANGGGMIPPTFFLPLGLLASWDLGWQQRLVVFKTTRC